MKNNITVSVPNLQAKRMLAIRFKRDQLRETINKLDAEYDLLRNNLLGVMQENSVLTLKTEDYTISRKKMKTVTVLDDARAIDELQNKGYQPSITVKLNWRAMGQGIYKALNEGVLKGVAEVKITEYVAITKAGDISKA
jgi:regulator of replication initiation timing